MIRVIGKQFILDTKNTTYCFRVTDTGHLEHLYWGKTITIDDESDARCMFRKSEFGAGNTVEYDHEHLGFTLEDTPLEFGTLGKGDLKEPLIDVSCDNGNTTLDLLYESHEIIPGVVSPDTMPGAYVYTGDDKCDAIDVTTLKITLLDKEASLRLDLYYCAFSDCDVITRRCVLHNDGDKDVVVNRLLSMSLDLFGSGYVVSSFTGAWAREMTKHDMPLLAGKYVIESRCGTTSNRANPFFMVSMPNTGEDMGECYAFNLIYSSDHYEACEVGVYNSTRIVTGINPESFRWTLEPKGSLESPEAVMTYSNAGFNMISHRMHKFIKKHIVRGKWANKMRPILINNWEATYFDLNEKKLLNLAKKAKELGIELFVMDDGWFGNRNDDSSSLGDWEVNKEKLPAGLKGLADKINKLGLDFGIWVEPEMISVESSLYKKHPDWAIDVPMRSHSEGRNQRILDLANKEVCDFIIEKMSKVFSSANISYVKWDMNRVFSDVYSRALEPEKQGEMKHRYVMGLYSIMGELTKRFPDILFEGCASGGNRFDLGILSYFPQIWASDNTDAICRAKIMKGYSYGYPQSVIGAHVSNCPNHQTLRNSPLMTRFNVSAFGLLGYELNVCDLPHEQLDEIKEQINIYKKYRKTLQFGDLYRTDNANLAARYSNGTYNTDENIYQFTVVSPDKKEAITSVIQVLAYANTKDLWIKIPGLKDELIYRFSNEKSWHNIMEFGDLVNTASPIHIKQGSLMHRAVAKFVKMPGESEEYITYGSVYKNAGVKLSQGFCATGYSEQVRYFPDFASRIYFINALPNK